ncbi:MAG: hypothetical protein KF749_14190 [Bacteroidetes bacterium]|nr:hypothetical protein [Bacteroidota bacterium]MCW5894068.1 hypothetical protein [Bacteroidota bacterium]
MWGRIVVLLFGIMFSVGDLSAQTRGFGLGVILGEPTGISAKGWVSDRNAIDAGLAWSFRQRGSFHLHVDYLWHFPEAIKSPERFTLYAGLGGRFSAGRRDGILGVRFAGGFAWWPRGIPLDVFVEIAPIFDIVPATEARANGGIGIRYFF